MKCLLLLVFLVCVLLIATPVLCAEVTHWRFQNGGYCLPCRDDHERLYMNASLWLLHCSKSGKQRNTWLVGGSRAATFQPSPQLFEWERKICFGFTDAERTLKRGWASLPGIKLIQMPAAPSALETCTLGSLQQVLRQPATAPLTVVQTTAVVPRRDVLDYFRLPMRTHDLVHVTYSSDEAD